MELKAGRSFDKLIAGRLGYATRHIQPHDPARPKWEMISPDNLVADLWVQLPFYTTSLDAAIGLVNDLADGIDVCYFEIGYSKQSAKWYGYIDLGNHRIESEADSPALAVCRAWWAWMDS